MGNTEQEMVLFLRKYIQINTSHPRPDYDCAIKLFEDQAKRDGFETRIINLPSGFKVLVITLQGVDVQLPAIALNHHMDVVPVGSLQHKHSPFSGQKENGFIYGRGTQDMKGVGVVHYFALRKVLREGMKLRRTVHLLIVPDEELGGFNGTGQLVKTPEFEKLNIEYVLDEGIPSGSNDSLFIKISERKPLQVKLVSNGNMGHGSDINNQNAIHELVLFLADMAKLQKAQKINSEYISSGLLLSVNVTSIDAGCDKTLNIIPGRATATIDIRVPFEMSLEKAKKILNEMLKPYPRMTYKVLAAAKDLSLKIDIKKSQLYSVLSKTIEEENLFSISFHAQEASDLRFYLEKGIEGVGFTPFTVKPNLHGIDECIKIKDLILGKKLMHKFLKNFCLE